MKIIEKIVNITCRFVGHTGVYFMLTILLVNALSGSGLSFSPNYFGVALLFGALMSLCDFILSAKFIPSLLAKSAIHAVCATVSFAVSLILISGAVEASTGFVAAVVFLIADATALAVRGVYISAQKNREKISENNRTE